MSGITANGATAYRKALEAEADAAIRRLTDQLARTSSPHEREELEGRIKAIRDELDRKLSATPFSLF